jgi:hypothetical protein
MLATELGPTVESFKYYEECAREAGYESGTQHRGYLWKVHVDETEELAEATARKYIQGPSNPFLEGNQGNVRSFIQNLPGLTSRTNLLPTSQVASAARARGKTDQLKDAAKSDMRGTFEEQSDKMGIVYGTPKTVIPKIRHVLETLRPGSIIFWDGDGAMDHDDAMRSLRLFGSDVLPAVREMGKELELDSPFDVDDEIPAGYSPEVVAAAKAAEARAAAQADAAGA